MDFGVHLPLIAFGGEQRTLAELIEVARTAELLGYSTLCANDHLVLGLPWLDGPTALAAGLAQTCSMRLMKTVARPVGRGPAAPAKALGAIELLSGGRLTGGGGPGSGAGA